MLSVYQIKTRVIKKALRMLMRDHKKFYLRYRSPSMLLNQSKKRRKMRMHSDSILTKIVKKLSSLTTNKLGLRVRKKVKKKFRLQSRILTLTVAINLPGRALLGTVA